MGPQPSSLNCQTNGLDERNQGTMNKESLQKQIKPKQPTEQSNKFSLNLQIQHALGSKPLGNLTRAPSEKNILKKQTKQLVEQKIFIPQHQALTKVSETPFKTSIKQKKFYVQDHAKSLAEIIEPRYNTMKHFPYSQILGLTESLVYGLAYMTKKNCNHHDFYPTNIYYSDGKFKVINPLEIQTSGFYLTSQRQRFSFLSPQLIIAILEEVSQNDIGQQTLGKADIFSIGMILLEITCLQPSSECYDAQSYNIVDSIIRQRLEKVSKVYTPVMAECINMMLQYEVERRIDPLTLGQLIHWKVENQKLVAMQMQAPKSQGPIPQQMGPMVPGMRNTMPPLQGMIPPNVIPQQIRGPPTSPYSHQSFKMQNLNQNVIAVTVPDEQFTRISPNNQGFLSSSSLQQKLRVIELIKQHPQQDEDLVDCESKYEESEQNQQDHQKNIQVTNNINSLQNRVNNTQKEVTKPMYPFVESIYSQKSLLTPSAGFAEYEQHKTPNIPQDPLVMRENKQSLMTQPQFKVKLNDKNLLTVPGMHNSPPPPPPLYQPVYQYQQLQERKVLQKKQVKNQQRQQRPLHRLDEMLVESHSIQDLSGSTGSSTYEQKPKPISGNNFTGQTSTYESGESKMVESPLQYQPLQRGKTQTQTFVTSFSYGSTMNSSKGSPPVKGSLYKDSQFNNFTQKINPIPTNQSYKKYGTSFQSKQGESIEQRVQRVLNMSRNAR